MEDEANSVRVAVRIRPQLPKELIGRLQNNAFLLCGFFYISSLKMDYKSVPINSFKNRIFD
jgi:hypothetical protein